MIEDRMRNDLRAAMKSRNSTRVSVLRTALAAMANAAAPAVETRAWPLPAAGSTEIDRLELSEADRQQVLTAQIADRRDTIAQYELNGRAEEAAALRAEVAILLEYQR